MCKASETAFVARWGNKVGDVILEGLDRTLVHLGDLVAVDEGGGKGPVIAGWKGVILAVLLVADNPDIGLFLKRFRFDGFWARGGDGWVRETTDLEGEPDQVSDADVPPVAIIAVIGGGAVVGQGS